jgi:prepilin-type N-terminal cleavage/methylation domain-containing protein
MKSTNDSFTNSRAFTLIELLVVISIIAILAGIALPVYQGVIMRGQQTQAVAQARQIGLALHLFADDNQGAFPTGTNSYGEKIQTSNDAFRSLFPNYVTDERIFTVPRAKVGSKADGKIEPEQEILKAGENHYAYVNGLQNTSQSTWPLVADGTDGSGNYTDVQTDPAGTWKGISAVVIYVDSSAAIVPLKGTGSSRYIPRSDDPTLNALNVASYMGSTITLIEPEPPQ